MCDVAPELFRRKADFYARMFPDVPAVSYLPTAGEKLHPRPFPHPALPSISGETEMTSARTVVLVDVRSGPERSVSVLRGSVSLRKFESDVISGGTLPENITVITYCTIGYRSGIEARRLRDRYRLRPGRAAHLWGGLVGHTHALKETEEIDQEREGKEKASNSRGGEAENTRGRSSGRSDHIAAAEHTPSPPTPLLIDPCTDLPTRRVHTFGNRWSCVAESYHPVYFSPAALVMRSAQTGILTVLRTFQRLQCLVCISVVLFLMTIVFHWDSRTYHPN